MARPQHIAARQTPLAKAIALARKKARAQALASQLALLWGAIGGPKLVPEYRFHPVRQWRFDFAHVESKVAIEIEGGVYSGGAHVRGAHFESDCEKYNTATLMGWRVFRLTAGMIRLGNLEPLALVTRNAEGGTGNGAKNTKHQTPNTKGGLCG